MGLRETHQNHSVGDLLEQDARPCDSSTIIEFIGWVLLFELCDPPGAQPGLEVSSQLFDNIVNVE